MKPKTKPLFIELDASLDKKIRGIAKKNRRTLKSQVTLLLEKASASEDPR